MPPYLSRTAHLSRTVRTYAVITKLHRIALHNDLAIRPSREANEQQAEDTRATHLIP